MNNLYVCMLYATQNDLLLRKLLEFYKKNDYLNKILSIINGENKMSLRLIDWFVTNYAKKYYVVYNIKEKGCLKDLRYTQIIN